MAPSERTKVTARTRFWCEGCKAEIPGRLDSFGWTIPSTEGCLLVHPSLVPPWFPVLVQELVSGEEWKGDDAGAEDWSTLEVLTNPVQLGILTKEQFEILSPTKASRIK